MSERWIGGIGMRWSGAAAVLLAGGWMQGQATPAHEQMEGMQAHEHAAAKPSTSLLVTVAGAVTTLTPEELRGMPQQTVKVMNGHTKMEESYAGPRLNDVLARAGAKLGKETLHGYVAAKGTDGYWVLYSGEEIVSAAHAGEVIVAIEVGRKALGGDGAMKLVSTEDKKPERWVRNLTAVEWKLTE